MLKIAYFNAASELDNTISLGSLFHSKGGFICSMRCIAITFVGWKFLLSLSLNSMKNSNRQNATAIRVCCKCALSLDSRGQVPQVTTTGHFLI